MRRIFADAAYWVALLNSRDQLHAEAAALNRELNVGQAFLVTTEFVLAEVLNFYAQAGPTARGTAAELAASVLRHTRAEVVPSTRELFAQGISFYDQRRDKHHSLIDCISMVVMSQAGITEVLTQDRHFHQEGFLPLLPRRPQPPA